MSHSWPNLPVELKLEVLVYGIEEHDLNMENFLSPIIATCNRELVTLALDIYYKHNLFYIEDYGEADLGECAES
jgi:hypothetical protein